jgi:hypothetical protein
MTGFCGDMTDAAVIERGGIERAEYGCRNGRDIAV